MHQSLMSADQATSLRRIHASLAPSPAIKGRVISIASGKGGVGKSNLALNLAIALAKLKRQITLIDLDIGLANIPILLGIQPKYTLEDTFNGKLSLADIALNGPSGIKILPSASGINQLVQLETEGQTRLLQNLAQIPWNTDDWILDTAAGISPQVLQFNAAADQIIVVTTPEPTSFTDAYALIKLLRLQHHKTQFSLIINQSRSPQETKHVHQKMQQACFQFLNIPLPLLGHIPQDTAIPTAVRNRQPLLKLFPHSAASLHIQQIAHNIHQQYPKQATQHRPAISAFWKRIWQQ